MVELQQELKCKTQAISEGVLIFDEVKVGLGLQWSSRNDEFIGHAMNSSKMSTLHDVYKFFSSTQITHLRHICSSHFGEISALIMTQSVHTIPAVVD